MAVPLRPYPTPHFYKKRAVILGKYCNKPVKMITDKLNMICLCVEKLSKVIYFLFQNFTK